MKQVMRNRNIIRHLNLLVSLLFLNLYSVNGQDHKTQGNHEWDFKLTIGESFMSIGSGFINSLNQTFSNSDLRLGSRLSTNLEIGRIFKNHMKIGINSGIDGIRVKNSPVHYDPYKFNIFGISPVFGYEIGKSFSISAGPSFNHISYSPTGVTDLSAFNKGGYIIASSIKFPVKSEFYVQLDFLYRYISQIDKLEVDFYNHNSFFCYELNTSHLYIGIGIGMRFN